MQNIDRGHQRREFSNCTIFYGLAKFWLILIMSHEPEIKLQRILEQKVSGGTDEYTFGEWQAD